MPGTNPARKRFCFQSNGVSQDATGDKSVKTAMIFAAIAAPMALAACGSQEAQKVENAYDNQADIIENHAANVEATGENAAAAVQANTANAADQLRNTADAVREKGEAKADAIDASK
ncbi:MAG TPA: hypothetical protein VFF84_02485 [Sphingobium sp.]|nr:hypothetical protein [Sphingobium sp.]